MAQVMPPLRFIAQPRNSYRLRYVCEGRANRNRAQRFVRADDNPEKYIYPTIEIPIEWITQLPRVFYIRLSHVTLPTDQVNIRCVHPYPIDSEDTHVIKDPTTNSLYFPVTEDELVTGRKSFQFTLYKLTQYQLRTHGPLRLLNSDLKDDQRLEDPTDPRKIIDTYQLGQSQLLCSLAVLETSQLIPIVYDVSSVYSQIMNAMASQTNEDDISVRCTPTRGDHLGGDEILMVIPKIDKRRAFTVRFDHPSMDERSTLSMVFVDNKTISFYTPPCPVSLTRENPSVTMSIVVTQNDVQLARIDFVYQSMDLCLNCNNLKRSHTVFEETDSMNLESLTICQENNSNFIRDYLTAIRSCSKNLSDLLIDFEKAIVKGNINLSLQLLKQKKTLIEQTNEFGQTPLLIAAKHNQNQLIMMILKKGLKYAEHTDKQGNNLFHILAQLENNQAKETIENVLASIDSSLREYLISGVNHQNQTPENLAKSNGNTDLISLLQ